MGWIPASSYASDEKSRQTKTVFVYTGFISGTEFLDMNTVEKRAYACGIIDGILVSSLFGADKQNIKQFNSCVTGMSNAQVAAIISKYLNDNPELWHEPLHITTVNAFSKFCDIAFMRNSIPDRVDITDELVKEIEAKRSRGK